LQNAITGQPTSDQLNYNAQQYVQAANNMRQTLLSQGVTPPPELDPATVAAQAASDQQAYAALNGGTAGRANGSDTMNGWTMEVCDVCRLLDGDLRQKQCQYCNTCQAWICYLDLPNMRRRAKAMFKRAMGRG
jgi:hypothetical protein